MTHLRSFRGRPGIPLARRPPLGRVLVTFLTRPGAADRARRAARVSGAVGDIFGTGSFLAGVTASLGAMEPLPCSLSTDALVELLKQPTCTGAARRVILNQLENRYHRSFADHWEFVRFAQEQHLGLDFTSPPNHLAGSPGGETK